MELTIKQTKTVSVRDDGLAIAGMFEVIDEDCASGCKKVLDAIGNFKDLVIGYVGLMRSRIGTLNIYKQFDKQSSFKQEGEKVFKGWCVSATFILEFRIEETVSIVPIVDYIVRNHGHFTIYTGLTKDGEEETRKFLLETLEHEARIKANALASSIYKPTIVIKKVEYGIDNTKNRSGYDFLEASPKTNQQDITEDNVAIVQMCDDLFLHSSNITDVSDSATFYFSVS